MSRLRAPTGIKVAPIPYEDFQGLDTSRDPVGLDTGKQQHFVVCNNAHCDFRGNLVRDPGANVYENINEGQIEHMRFFGKDRIAWAQKTGRAIDLRSQGGVDSVDGFPITSRITSTNFDRKTIFFARGQKPIWFDGAKFFDTESAADLNPSFGVAVQQRLAVAGIVGSPTQIHFSRVDDGNVFADDEDTNATEVTRGAFLDIANQLNTADDITGLGVLEKNRLAVFTNDQGILFKIDPDLTLWELEDRANISVGCMSHNTICNAGADLLFCSRSGVHSVRRSVTNGISVFTVPLSEKIDILWRSLVAQVDDHTKINAVFDPDENQYHVFFPITDSLSKRLTFTISPSKQIESKWSTGTFLNARCGAFLGGRLLYGTSGGIHEISNIEDVASATPEIEVVTPTLWLGSITDITTIHSLVIQAAGTGTLLVEIRDTYTNEVIYSQTLEIEEQVVDDSFSDNPLPQQYERKVERRASGVRLVFKSQGTGLLRVVGFAFYVRE
ncbi:MAG: hypothetical protein CMB77_07150 [Euryarchaeota archaeon]|nr:hypothetical protein [Euryarchaeota archaeon]